MNRCSLEWILWAIAMIIFAVLALNGRWTDLGIALTVAAVLWYVVVPEYQSRRQ